MKKLIKIALSVLVVLTCSLTVKVKADVQNGLYAYVGEGDFNEDTNAENFVQDLYGTVGSEVKLVLVEIDGSTRNYVTIDELYISNNPENRNVSKGPADNYVSLIPHNSGVYEVGFKDKHINLWVAVSDGLYAYTGQNKSEYSTDNDPRNFVKEIRGREKNPFDLVLVSINDGVRTLINETDINISNNPGNCNISTKQETGFISLIPHYSGGYDITYGNSSIKFMVDVKDGLYAYTGTHSYLDDLSFFNTEINVTVGSTFKLVLVDVTNGVKTYIGKNNFTVSNNEENNLTLTEQTGFVDIVANKTGTYEISYNSKKIIFNVAEPLKAGLYVYRGTIDPLSDNDPHNFGITLQGRMNVDDDIFFIVFDDGKGNRKFVDPSELTCDSSYVTLSKFVPEEPFVKVKTTAPVHNLKINYKDTDDKTYSIYLNVFSDAIDHGTPSFNYNDKDYLFALSYWNNSPTDKPFVVDYMDLRERDTDRIFDMVLLAGNHRNDCEIAPVGLIDAITNFDVSLEMSTLPQGSVIINKLDKVNAFDRSLFAINVTVKANTYGDIVLRADFDLDFGGGNVQHMVVRYVFYVWHPIVENLDLTNEEMANFNTIFGSKNSMFEHFGFPSDYDVNDIYINLPAGTYNDNFTINLNDFNVNDVAKSITISGLQSDESKTTINGTLCLNGGIVEIDNINFVANDDIKTGYSSESINIPEGTMGVVCKFTQGCERADIAEMYDCTFSGYDYALVSTPDGIVAGFKNCEFNNCDYCYYMNCGNSEFFTGGPPIENNVFINSNQAAFAFIDTPNNMPSYAWMINYNKFYNSVNTDQDKLKADFYLGEGGTDDWEAISYFMFNYYGKTGKEFKNNNLRSAKIEYAGSVKKNRTKVITNPCIKYPEDVNRFGIDNAQGLSTAIFKGNKVIVNSKDKNLIKFIEIADSTNKNVVGGLKHE